MIHLKKVDNIRVLTLLAVGCEGFGVCATKQRVPFVLFISMYSNPSMPYDPARHGTYKDAYDYHKQQNPQQSNDWIDKLKREFYDRGNSVGTDALYSAIQKRHPAANAYPTKRFVRAWLRRQATVQVHQRLR